MAKCVYSIFTGFGTAKIRGGGPLSLKVWGICSSALGSVITVFCYNSGYLGFSVLGCSGLSCTAGREAKMHRRHTPTEIRNLTISEPLQQKRLRYLSAQIDVKRGVAKTTGRLANISTHALAQGRHGFEDLSFRKFRAPSRPASGI